MTRVAINGFGRIGRAFFRLSQKEDDIEVVAINDLGDIENLAYLLKYDSAQGKADFEVDAKTGDDSALVVDGREIPYISNKDPEELPWEEMDVDVVVESTGVFTTYEQSEAHVRAGAKKVVVSASIKDKPQKDIHGATVLVGVNDQDDLKEGVISSNASCTTNAGGSVVQVLNDMLGIKKAVLNTVHGYTASQNLVDSPNPKIRRGRAAAQNIVPTTTGAAVATTKVITDLEDKFDGIALRVPVIAGSIADITFVSEKDTSVEEVNDILKTASEQERWKGVFSVTDEPLVSSDIIGKTYASIVDLDMTRVVDGDLVKILAWYDNEMGYTHTLVQHVKRAANQLD